MKFRVASKSEETHPENTDEKVLHRPRACFQMVLEKQHGGKPIEYFNTFFKVVFKQLRAYS